MATTIPSERESVLKWGVAVAVGKITLRIDDGRGRFNGLQRRMRNSGEICPIMDLLIPHPSY